MNRRKKICKRDNTVFICLLAVVAIVITIVLIGYTVHTELNKFDDAASSPIISSSGKETSYKKNDYKEDYNKSVDNLLTGLPQKLQELYENNEDAREFVLGYMENKNKVYTIDLSEYENCNQVPLLMQWDERWGYENYSGDLFGLTGCGPTCLSMAAIYLKQNIAYNPKWMKEFSEEQGYSVEGSGSSWTLISEGAAKLGIGVMELPLDEDIMKNSLSDNSVIIAVVGPGDFTASGHFIVITGYTENGFKINDPNSYKNSGRQWSYDELYGQIRNIWKLYV